MGSPQDLPFEVRTISLGAHQERGCFATRALARGERVCTFTGSLISSADYIAKVRRREIRVDDPLEIDEGRLLLVDAPFLFINHSCEPNTLFSGALDLVVLRDVQPGEEITFDYSTTISSRSPYVMKFVCACGVSQCRRRIGNVASIPPPQLRRYYEAGIMQARIRSEVEAILSEDRA